MLSIYVSKEETLVSKLPRKLFWESNAASVGSSSGKERISVGVDPLQLDIDVVESLHVPDTFSFANFSESARFTNPQDLAAVKVIQHTLHSLVGKYGTMRQFKDTVSDTKHDNCKASAVDRHHQTGSLNGGVLRLPPRQKDSGQGVNVFFSTSRARPVPVWR